MDGSLFKESYFTTKKSLNDYLMGEFGKLFFDEMFETQTVEKETYVDPYDNQTVMRLVNKTQERYEQSIFSFLNQDVYGTLRLHSVRFAFLSNYWF